MKRFLILVTLFAIVASSISLFAASSTSLAQRPTPTNIVSPTPTKTGGDTGSSKHTSGKSPFVPPQEGAVWGYVIDYSGGGAPQAGVAVVLDGGGWSAETVTDSNGFYQFAGLGSGEATLRLKLPPEAHPVNQNWRIHTGSANPQATNLGFYWGDTPPLPVVATVKTKNATVAAGKSTSLTVVIKNQSGGDAHNLLLTASLPPELTASSITAPSGIETDTAEHSATILMASLQNGETATFTLDVTAADTLSDTPLTVDVSLVYDEQLTPQQVSVALQPNESKMGTAANTESIIPETGGAQENTSPAMPIVVISALFVLGLAYAGLRGFVRRS